MGNFEDIAMGVSYDRLFHMMIERKITNAQLMNVPPVSRFGGGNRAKKKQGIIAKLKAFFEKYFGLGISELKAEK